jgi:succinate dehydrogenase / fumarate reductase, iron-sulfur subunit
MKGKVSPKIAIFGHKIPKRDLDSVKRIYDRVEGKPERYELNLYITGFDEDNEEQPLAAVASDTTPSSEGSTNS